jgi:hypothetical protein
MKIRPTPLAQASRFGVVARVVASLAELRKDGAFERD